jgi:hypothetical protein
MRPFSVSSVGLKTEMHIYTYIIGVYVHFSSKRYKALVIFSFWYVKLRLISQAQANRKLKI